MPQLRRLTVVAAPPTLVAGVLRDTDAATDALRRVGCEFRCPVRLLVAGDEVDVALRGRAGRMLRCRTRITGAGVGGMTSELVSGPAAALRHVTTVRADGAGSQVLDELSWTAPFGPLGRVLDPQVHRFGRGLLRARAHVLAERVQRLRTAPVVVGAAIVRDGRLLAARRAYPPELAGRWELPGGGVEPGEREPDALRRECREELGTDVDVDGGGRVGTDLPIGDPDGGRLLRIHRARVRPGAPEPRAHEHRELRWAGPAELATLGWLDADRAVVAELRALLDGDRNGEARSPVPDR